MSKTRKDRRSRAVPRWRVGQLAVVGALSLLVCAGTSSQAQAGFELGLTDDQTFKDPASSVRSAWLDRAATSGSDVILIGASWRAIAPPSRGGGFDPTDPGDPAYNWGTLDEAVTDATSRGLRVLMLVTHGPDWAEGSNRPSGVAPGTWKPNPGDVGDFAQAIAARYSGNYRGILGPTLPRVSRWQLWAEPNLAVYLTPQWRGGDPVAPDHYRRMLNRFHKSVKSVSSSNKVVTGGTAPYGDPRGGSRMRPLKFWREVFCLRGKTRNLGVAKCKRKAKFDVLAHNPINTSGGPRQSAVHPDNVTTPDLRNLRKTLKFAERHNRVKGPARHALYATEMWWESNPPDTLRGVRLRKHAEYIALAIYLLWKQGADLVVNFQIRDAPYDGNDPTSALQSGLYFRGGDAKPARAAFRFPHVADRRSNGRTVLWARSPAAGTLEFQRKANGRWRTIARRPTKPGGVEKVSIRLPAGAKTRARVGEDVSIAWGR